MPLLCDANFKEFGSLVCLWHDVKLRKTQLEVRSFNATWSRDLWGHRFLEMCQIVGSNCWQIVGSYGKFGGATRSRFFFAVCEKPYGGGGVKSTPRRCEGVKQPSKLTGCSFLGQVTSTPSDKKLQGIHFAPVSFTFRICHALYR